MSREELLGMGRFQRMLFIRTLPAFMDLEPEVAAAAAALTTENFFKRGAYLHTAGTAPTGVHYIVRGLVEIRRNGRPVRTLGTRGIVGGASVLSGDEQGYDCVALEDTVTLESQFDDAQEIFEDHFALLRGVLRGTSVELLNARRSLGPTAGFGTTSDDFEIPDRPFDFVEKMAFLQKTLPFAEGKIDAIADLAQEVTERRVPRGEVLWNIGDASDHFLFPLQGVVRCDAEAPPQQFRLGPGDAVGGLDSMADLPRWYKAVAERDLVLFRINIDDFLDVLEDNYDVAMSMLRALAKGRMELYDLQVENNVSDTVLPDAATG